MTVSRHPFHPPVARPIEQWPSVRLARLRARERERVASIRTLRVASIRTLDLEHLLHGELLAEMASVLSAPPATPREPPER